MDKPNLDQLLEDIKQGQKKLLSNDDMAISTLQSPDNLKEEFNVLGDEFRVDYIKFMIFERHYPDSLKDLAPLEKLFDVLTSVQRMSRALERHELPEIKKFVKFSTLRLAFRLRIIVMVYMAKGYGENWKKYMEDFFGRRNELPKDNVFRKIFVEEYIDDAVHTRFWKEIYARFSLEKTKESELFKARGLLYTPTYTPDGAKDWDARFNRLCDEYNEEQYKKVYNDPKDYYTRITCKDSLHGKSWLQWTSGLLDEIEPEANKTTKEWERNLVAAFCYLEIHKTRKITSAQDINALIEAVNVFYKLAKDPEVPPERTACLMWALKTQIQFAMNPYCSESWIGEELFARRGEIEKGNILRNYIVSDYVTDEAGYLCYIKATKEGEPKEYDETLKTLYQQYEEEDLSSWDVEAEDLRCREALPEDAKKYLAEQDAKGVRKYEKMREVFRKHEELKVSRGITDDEAFEFLSREERSILEKRRFVQDSARGTPIT